jgi:hypothetical protein
MRGGYVDVENLPAEAEIEAEGSEMTSQLVILLVLPMSGSNHFEPKVIPTHQEPILWPVKHLDTPQFKFYSSRTSYLNYWAGTDPEISNPGMPS